MSSRKARGISAPAGFTLLELLTVIAIIAILAGILIGVGRRASESGKNARAKAELLTIGSALEAYKHTYGDYPHTADGAVLLQSLLGKFGPAGVATTGRTFLETGKLVIALPANPTVAVDPTTNATAELMDPWGQPYVYVYRIPAASWTNPSFVLYSIGPDGADSPALLTGGFIDVAQPANTDNIYANRY
jgi:general secretion pathway protein G